MSKVELTHEELQIIRACIQVATQSISDNVVMATPREKELIESSNTDKLYMKFLG